MSKIGTFREYLTEAKIEKEINEKLEVDAILNESNPKTFEEALNAVKKFNEDMYDKYKKALLTDKDPAGAAQARAFEINLKLINGFLKMNLK